MPIALAVLFTLLAGAAAAPAQADPYRWCAVYDGEGGGGTNCYFVTLEQCRAAAVGAGNFCTPNNFYDGRPTGSDAQSNGPARVRGPARRP
jgi:hypothetical protein